jgi:hypothetical protein
MIFTAADWLAPMASSMRDRWFKQLSRIILWAPRSFGVAASSLLTSFFYKFWDHNEDVQPGIK